MNFGWRSFCRHSSVFSATFWRKYCRFQTTEHFTRMLQINRRDVLDTFRVLAGWHNSYCIHREDLMYTQAWRLPAESDRTFWSLCRFNDAEAEDCVHLVDCGHFSEFPTGWELFWRSTLNKCLNLMLYSTWDRAATKPGARLTLRAAASVLDKWTWIKSITSDFTCSKTHDWSGDAERWGFTKQHVNKHLQWRAENIK